MSKLYVIREEYSPNTAPFNRLVAFLNYLEKNEVDTELVFLYPNWENTKPEFSYKHIKVSFLYEHRRLFSNRIIAKLSAGIIIRKLVKEKIGGGDALVLGGGGLLLKQLTQAPNIRVFHEMTEHPDVMEWRVEKLKQIYLDSCKNLDGLFVISTALREYFISLGVPEERITIINMTVDPTRFEGVSKNPSVERYIAYCGTASNNKDGVNKLIEAFGLVAPKHKDVKLYIIGKTPSASDESGNLQLVETLGLKDRVVFTGVVPAADMPQLLTNATVLALARPDNLQAKNGFPTKLGEYLLTGNPVVVTKVGDISLFLKEGESALLAEPDDTQEFANKLCWALENPKEAQVIGKNGREVAMQKFNAAMETKKIMTTIGVESDNEQLLY